jgi:OOP family OmpA-OmpF porin
MKRFFMSITTTVFLLAVCVPNAVCGPAAGEVFLSPMIGGHVFEGNQDPFHGDEELDHAFTFGLGLGYQFTECLGTELFVNMTPTKADPGDVDVDVYPARLDLFYNITPDKALVPYVAAGLGAVTFSNSDVENDTDFMANYGAGLKYYLTDAIALRADVRHLISFTDTQSNLLYTVGMVFGFGGDRDKAAPAEEPKQEEKPAVVDTDSDGDGVADSLDACAGTPQGVAVDSKGCPVDSDGDGVSDDKDTCPGTEKGVTVDDKGCPVVAATVEADSDGDGVADSKDTCADTPKGVAVDENGCPVDTDKDGVSDDKDACPGTPIGATVNARGCWSIKDLRFETGKTTIMAESLPNLDEVVTVLESNPEMKLEVQGYTDNRGSAAFNKSLSEKRARAVMDYIVSKGIAAERISAKGYGIESPVATNDTAEGRALNRRVELKPM